jgi:phage head maturation protease
MSFDFVVISDEWGTDNGTRSRTVKQANIYEVCFTPDPAYLATSVEIEYRSKLIAAHPIIPEAVQHTKLTQATKAYVTIAQNLFGNK